MQRRAPRWSASMPALATAWVQWLNRHDNPRSIRLAAFLSVVIVTSALAGEWIHRVRVAAILADIAQYTATVAIFAAVIGAWVAARQRSLREARADRSWVAALPARIEARRVENWTLDLVPVAAVLVVLSGVGLLTGVLLGFAGFAAWPCIMVNGALVLGAVSGAVVRLAIPAAKPDILNPDSRYVPHRGTRGRRPVPSLGALGLWPIRRMFTLLQPKIASRTLFPVLLMVPLGSPAADAMIWIGAFGLAAAFVAVIASVFWVRRAALDWLRSLPLSASRVSWLVACRALLVMLALDGTTAWLLWTGRS